MTMYLEHFGLREAPFKITPHTEFFFAGANRGETLEALIYAITSGEGIVKVTGEVGAGKTMLCRVLMERLPKSVETIYFAIPSLSPDELLATIANDLGVSTDGVNITKVIRALQSRLIEIYGSGKRVVALIDEAHAMPVETLDQIRLLSNLETSQEKLMQIVLFGQPELDQHLSLPSIRQLKERITHGFTLLPLPAQDIKDYLNFRLRAAGYRGPDLFSADALKLITEASEGLTRRINIYADKTLLAAYAEGTHTVTAKHVRAAITDTQIVLAGQGNVQKRLWIAVGAALLAGIAIGFVAGRYSMSGTPAAPQTASTPLVSAIQPARPATQEITRRAEVATPVDPAIAKATPNTTESVVARDDPPAPKTGNSTPVAPIPPAPKAGSNEASNIQPKVPPKQQSVSAPSPIPAAYSKPAVSAEAPVQQPISGWLGKKIMADAARIAGMHKERYTIQLMNADERQQSAIETFLRGAGRELNAELLMAYPAGSAENPRVSVIYGDFDGATEASAELANLPARMSRFKAYARSFGAVQNDMRPGTP